MTIILARGSVRGHHDRYLSLSSVIRERRQGALLATLLSSRALFIVDTTAAILHYQRVYQKLYHCDPAGLRDLGAGWVQVNGARMQVSELERLTLQLQTEYRQRVASKRSVVQRLVQWLARQA